MCRSRLLVRLLLPCVLLGIAAACPAQAQAERPESPEVPADTTAQDSTAFFDARVASGHKPRRRGMRPSAGPAVPELASVAPAVSTATVAGAPPEATLPAGHVVVAPPPPQPARPGATYVAAPVTLDALTDEMDLAAAAAPLEPEVEAVAEMPDPVASGSIAEGSEVSPEASPAEAEPLVATLPAPPLAPEAEPVTVPEIPALSAPAPDAMMTPGSSEADTGETEPAEAGPGLFDTNIASGHKTLADVPPPTFFDTRIASGHKALVERDDLMFDSRVAEGYKVLPLPEPLAEYEDAVGITAAGHFVVSPEGMDYVLAEAVRVGRLFNTSGKRRRAYFPMIERALTRRNLPLELKYLALIESSMDPLAVSHAGARGLWQIMPETAGDFGADSMAVHDPKVATDIAVQYLGRLHRMFDGDWLLAIAAYNSGPGRVQGFVRQFERSQGRTPTFWDIRSRLPRETRDYVPRFLAALFYAQSDV